MTATPSMTQQMMLPVKLWEISIKHLCHKFLSIAAKADLVIYYGDESIEFQYQDTEGKISYQLAIPVIPGHRTI